MDDFGKQLVAAVIWLAVLAFLAGAAVVGVLVWLWPYLPAIRLDWGR